MREARAATGSEVDVTPFRHRGGRRGVLLVHGFAGTPFEMRGLGAALAARGFAVSVPALAGHGPDSARLRGTAWTDWLGSVEAAFDELRADCDVVGVCGLSLGGLLSLELARRRPGQVAALALLATALYLPPWQARGIRRASRSWLLKRLAMPKPLGSDIADPAMRRRNPTRSMPFATLASLVDCMEHVRPRLGEVACPALVAHGRKDHTIPFACADELAARLAGTVERMTLERSFHVLTLDLEREALFARIGDFFERHLAAARAAG
jgi:carboxylesterase